MKNSDIYDIISGIDEKYRTYSGDFQKIASDFKRSEIRRTEAYISLAASFVLVVFTGLNIYDTKSMIKQSDMLSPAYEPVSSAQQVLKETAPYSTDDIPDENTETAVSYLSENMPANTRKTVKINKGGNAAAGTARKNTEKAEISKTTSKTILTKTNISSVPVSEEKNKPAVTSAALPDKDNTAETDISDENNEGLEDPVLDEIVMSEKLTGFSYLTGNRIYATGAKMMDADNVGEKIEKGIVLRKYSSEENKMYYMTADTYRIKNISDEFAVAVKFPKINTFYLYKNLNYICNDLGKLIDDLDLENTLYITKMYDRYGSESIPFDDELVKSFISENRNAVNNDEIKGCKYAMRFRVDLPLLDLENYELVILKNGYLTTTLNGFDKDGFYIGEEAVQNLAYALNYSFDN